jgi:hypothetical protein
MRNYSRPTPHDSIPAKDRAVDWFGDRIDTCYICPCAILLKNLSTVVHDTLDTLGLTFFYQTDSSQYYSVPYNTKVGFVFTNRIKYHSPPHHSISIFDPLDIPWQNMIAGHEIGHMVNMPENLTNTNSIMNTITNPNHPPDHYVQDDVDYYRVKPFIW